MRVVKDRKGGNSQWEKGGHEGSEGQESINFVARHCPQLHGVLWQLDFNVLSTVYVDVRTIRPLDRWLLKGNGSEEASRALGVGK